MILGAMFSGAVEEAELVSRAGPVGWRWQGEVDGDVGEWELLVDGLLGVAGVGVAWVVMVAVDCWAERLGDSGGAVGWLWLGMAIEWWF